VVEKLIGEEGSKLIVIVQRIGKEPFKKSLKYWKFKQEKAKNYYHFSPKITDLSGRLYYISLAMRSFIY